MVQLNPEDGGVVVAMVRADVMVQENESLHVYQSTKEIRVNGGGFDGHFVVRAPFLCYGFIVLSHARDARGTMVFLVFLGVNSGVLETKAGQSRSLLFPSGSKWRRPRRAEPRFGTPKAGLRMYGMSVVFGCFGV